MVHYNDRFCIYKLSLAAGKRLHFKARHALAVIHFDGGALSVRGTGRSELAARGDWAFMPMRVPARIAAKGEATFYVVVLI